MQARSSTSKGCRVRSLGGLALGTTRWGSNGGAPLGGFAELFNLNETYTTQADLPFAVSMLVSAASQGSSTGSGSGTSYLDPYFSVPNGYSILLSNGVGNSLPPAVPEIPTWSMMLFGFWPWLLGLSLSDIAQGRLGRGGLIVPQFDFGEAAERRPFLLAVRLVRSRS